MKFLDANIFLRYLTRDDEKKAQACFRLFQAVKNGKTRVTTGESIIAEVAYVLSSKKIYNLSHEEVAARLRPLLLLKGFHLPKRRLYLRALDIYVSHSEFDFEDALTVAHMEDKKIHELLSYDRDFDKVKTIQRIEP